MSPQRTSGVLSADRAVPAGDAVGVVLPPEGFVAGVAGGAVAVTLAPGEAVSLTVPDVFAVPEPPNAPATATSSAMAATEIAIRPQRKAEYQRLLSAFFFAPTGAFLRAFAIS